MLESENRLLGNEKFLLQSWEYALERFFDVEARDVCTSITRFSMYKHLSTWLLSSFNDLSDSQLADEQKILERYRERVAEDEQKIREELIEANGFYIAPQDLYQTWLENIEQQHFDVNALIESIRRVETMIFQWMNNDPVEGFDIKVEEDDLADLALKEAPEKREAYLKNMILLVNKQTSEQIETLLLTPEFLKLDNEIRAFRNMHEQTELYLYEALCEREALRRQYEPTRNDTVLFEGHEEIEKEVKKIVNGRYRNHINYVLLPDESLANMFTHPSVVEEASSLLTAIDQLNFQYFRKFRSIDKKTDVLRLRNDMKKAFSHTIQQHLDVSMEQIDQLFMEYFWTKSLRKDLQKVRAFGFDEAVTSQIIELVWHHRPLNRKVSIRDKKGRYLPMTLLQVKHFLLLLEEKRDLIKRIEPYSRKERKIYHMDEIDLRIEVKGFEKRFESEMQELFDTPNNGANFQDYEIHTIMFEKWFGPLRDQTMRLYMKSLQTVHEQLMV